VILKSWFVHLIGGKKMQLLGASEAAAIERAVVLKPSGRPLRRRLDGGEHDQQDDDDLAQGILVVDMAALRMVRAPAAKERHSPSNVQRAVRSDRAVVYRCAVR
jgi:hypothetical protein